MAVEEKVLGEMNEKEAQGEPESRQEEIGLRPEDLPPGVRKLLTQKDSEIKRLRQAANGKISELQKQIEELKRKHEEALSALNTYNQWASVLNNYIPEQQVSTQTSSQTQAQPQMQLPEINPWDPDSIRTYVDAAIAAHNQAWANYAQQLTQYYNYWLNHYAQRAAEIAVNVARTLDQHPELYDRLNDLYMLAVQKHQGNVLKAADELATQYKEKSALESKLKEYEKQIQQLRQGVGLGATQAPAPPVLPQDTSTATVRKAGDTGRYAQILSQTIGKQGAVA